MDDDAYTFVFYGPDGTGYPAMLEKSDISRVFIERRHEFAGMRPTFSWVRSGIMAALFGGAAGAAEMVATTRRRSEYGQRWRFVVECPDGTAIELEFDGDWAYRGDLTKQGVATFLKDFKRHRNRYAA